MSKASRPRSRRVIGAASPPVVSAGTTGLAWRCGLIVLAGALAYSNTFSNPFILDDLGMFTVNPQIHHLSNLREFFALTPGESPVAERPLPNIAFALNYVLGGTNVWGYHAVNLALHVCAGLLVFALVRRTLELSGVPDRLSRSSSEIGLAVALFWVLHPVNSEVVDYLVQRTESMMAVCYLLTFYASLRTFQSVSHRRAWTGLAWMACVTGMACKESMVTAPVMLVLYDRTFLFASLKDQFQHRHRLYAGLMAGWIVLAGLIIGMHGHHSGTGFATLQISWWSYLMNQTLMITRYLRLSVWPHGLVVFYGWARPVGLLDVWPYLLFILLLIAGSVALYVRRPRLGFCAIWFWITLSPASSFVAMAGEVGAERRMYLPLIGLITLAVVSVVWLERFSDRRSADRTAVRGAWADQSSVRPTYGLAVVVSISGFLMLGTLVRNREYASGMRMAETVIDRWPTPIAHDMMGTELVDASRLDEAIDHLRQAAPEYPPSRYNLGAALLRKGSLDEGIEQLQAFIRQEPESFLVRQARLTIGRAFEAKRDWPHAIETYEVLLARSTDDLEAHGLLAEALAGQQRFRDAIPHYEAVLGMHGNEAGAWAGLGIARIATGETDGAISAFRTAVGLEPNNSEYHRNLATALFERGDVPQAADHAGQALAMSPNDALSHELMGRVRLSQGDADAARREFEQALRLNRDSVAARQALTILNSKR